MQAMIFILHRWPTHYSMFVSKIWSGVEILDSLSMLVQVYRWVALPTTSKEDSIRSRYQASSRKERRPCLLRLRMVPLSSQGAPVVLGGYPHCTSRISVGRSSPRCAKRQIRRVSCQRPRHEVAGTS